MHIKVALCFTSITVTLAIGPSACTLWFGATAAPCITKLREKLREPRWGACGMVWRLLGAWHVEEVPFSRS